MKSPISRWCALGVLAIIVSVAFVACELTDDPDINDLTTYLNNDTFSALSSDLWLTIAPSDTTLADDEDRETFTASGGQRPYTWSVWTSLVGRVELESGATAVYRRIQRGDQVLVVEDATGSRAYATISQPFEEYDIAVSPTSETLSADGETVQIAVSGGTPPYIWLRTEPSGRIIGGGNMIVYQRLTSTNNVLTVRDAHGQTAYCSISQPVISSPSISPSSVTLDMTNDLSFAFTVSGGEPPYVWTMASGAGNALGSGTSALYTRIPADANGVIQVVDGNSATGYASITISP